MSNKNCIKCNEARTKESLEQVGKFWREGFKTIKHPLETLIEYAEKQGSQSLANQLKDNLENGEATYIHRAVEQNLETNLVKSKKKFHTKRMKYHLNRGNYLTLKANVSIVNDRVSVIRNTPIETSTKKSEQRIQVYTLKQLNYVNQEVIKALTIF